LNFEEVARKELGPGAFSETPDGNEAPGHSPNRSWQWSKRLSEPSD
jgi:hypothetical protein